MSVAVQNEAVVVVSPGKLIVPPAEAAKAVWAQIERGRAIRKTKLRYAEELEKAREFKAEWVGQTIELLKSMFDTEAVAAEFSTWDARVLPEYAEVGLFIEVFYEEMDQRLGRLESIHRRIPANGGAPAAKGQPATAAAILRPGVRAFSPSPAPAASAAGPATPAQTPQVSSAPGGAASGREAEDREWSAAAAAASSSRQGSACLLVLHGEGGEAAERMAGFVSLLGFEANRVQADAGDAKAVIEALDQHENSGFAVILLDGPTAAAVRSGSGDPLDRRFVFQLGCCVGRLGQRRVCVLVPEGTGTTGTEEHGVLFIPMDAADGWQLQLARQLKRSGIEIDLNRLC